MCVQHFLKWNIKNNYPKHKGIIGSHLNKIKMQKEVKEICSSTDMHLHKYIPNSIGISNIHPMLSKNKKCTPRRNNKKLRTYLYYPFYGPLHSFIITMYTAQNTEHSNVNIKHIQI